MTAGASEFSRFDHECMALALQLACRGMYTTDPNPRVGCVIARDERVLGRGWHEFAGGPHAEIVALRDADEPVSGATAYVSLEPCCHHGRTAPCTEALIEAGVGRVVVAAEDPNPRVAGGGRQRLQAAGVRVQSGLMAAESAALNPGFMKRMSFGLPWVRVKAAISLDGRTALRNGESRWISSAASRRDVQRWRARSSAVLTGIGTVLADDPSMNARLDAPASQPLRVVADTSWRTSAGSRILHDPATALIAGSRERPVPEPLKASGVRCLPLPEKAGRIELEDLLKALAAEEINEIQVEAGARLCGALLRSGLVDEILIYQAPVLLGEGGPGPFEIGQLESMAQRTHLSVLETTSLGGDFRIRLQPQERNSQEDD